MIPVNEPLISKNAKKYVDDCLASGWISSAGKYLSRFEEVFSRYLGVRYGITTTSGTSALHLAVASLGIGKGDEVILPDLTIISCAYAVIYTGATPVVVDVDSTFGNINPNKIEEKITKRTKAIMVVHLYGHPADLDPIIKIAKKYNLYLIEDAAEAHGAEIEIKDQRSEIKNTDKKLKINSATMFQWKKVGSIGDVGCFSFYANKIVTTGEGGMVVTNDQQIYEKAILLKDLAHSPKRRFLHEEIGFNYRMTNLQAALGLAQLEEIDTYIEKKRWMVKQYEKDLKEVNFLELPKEAPWAKSVCWMYAVRLKENSPISRDKFCQRLKHLGVDTREYFIPIHRQSVLRKLGLFKNESCPVADDLSRRGFYLPSGLAITKNQVERVIRAVKKISSTSK